MMNKTFDTESIQKLCARFNTTAYKILDGGVLQIKHFQTGMYHYFDAKSFDELPMQSITDIFEEK